jgi:hypothetical protein
VIFPICEGTYEHGGHSVPRTEMIKESLDWLDRYLGRVE